MTTRGSVYAAISKDYRQFDGWAVLDRSKEVWHKVDGYPGDRIIGSADESLVFSRRDGSSTVLFSVPSRSLQSENPQEAALLN
jgi:hypothetical protein